MPLSTYTTPDEVRAALGVSATELTDAVLAIPSYVLVATLALEDINVGLPALYTTTVAIPTPTPDQQRFIDLTKLYATYSIAQNLLTSLPLFAVKALTDGRASFERIADPFEYIRDDLPALLAALKLRLAAIYTTLAGGSAYVRPTLLQVLATGLSLDPVTNT